jgi:hypothetical protein
LIINGAAKLLEPTVNKHALANKKRIGAMKAFIELGL